MTSTGNSNPPFSFKTHYNPKKRKEEIAAQLKSELEKVSAHMDSFVKEELKKEPAHDYITLIILQKEFELARITKEVNEFEGPHFNQIYRRLQGHCEKLQTDLDALDVSGTPDLRDRKKLVIVSLETISRELAGKTHENGKACEKCEIKA